MKQRSKVQPRAEPRPEPRQQQENESSKRLVTDMSKRNVTNEKIVPERRDPRAVSSEDVGARDQRVGSAIAVGNIDRDKRVVDIASAKVVKSDVVYSVLSGNRKVSVTLDADTNEVEEAMNNLNVGGHKHSDQKIENSSSSRLVDERQTKTANQIIVTEKKFVSSNHLKHEHSEPKFTPDRSSSDRPQAKGAWLDTSSSMARTRRLQVDCP